MKYKVLTGRERKKMLQQIGEQWGFTAEKTELKEYVFILTGKQNLYFATRDVFEVDFSKLHVNSAGLYVAETYDGIRLSIEGSQLIGPFATKNFVEFDEKEMFDWLKGQAIEKAPEAGEEWGDIVILKHKNPETGMDDFIGCGKYKKADEHGSPSRILNFVPKARRLSINA